MAQTDINAILNAQPPNLPYNVRRVTANGLPTQHLIDWEYFQTDWFRTNVVKVDQRIDTVQATADSASAAVTTEASARASADEALAEQITTVAASVDDSTANGQIYFAAAAAPGGAVAAYGLYLTAGNAFTGLEAVAMSDGTSAISFSANKFMLNDSGTAQNVFNYSSGIFTFNVPVRVGTVDIAAQAVNAPVAAASGSVVQFGAPVGWTTILSVAATGVADGLAVVDVNFEYLKFQPSGGFAIIGGNWQVVRSDGLVLGSGNLQNIVDYFPVSRRYLDTSFQSTYTYDLQISTFISSGSGSGAYFQFGTRSLMIDMRKR